MHSDTLDILDKERLTTKKPFCYYLTLVLWGILLVSFIAITKTRQFDNDSTLTTAIIFIFFAIYFYILFGRYLSTITFYDHRIEINYLFPWNKDILFRFDKLSAIEFKEFELVDRLTRGWYRGGKWLYLKNEKNEACQFKYNINPSDNRKLLQELQKKCNSEVVYS